MQRNEARSGETCEAHTPKRAVDVRADSSGRVINRAAALTVRCPSVTRGTSATVSERGGPMLAVAKVGNRAAQLDAGLRSAVRKALTALTDPLQSVAIWRSGRS